MVKRLEELPPGEQTRLMEVCQTVCTHHDQGAHGQPQEVEGEREQREARRKAWQEAQKKQEQ